MKKSDRILIIIVLLACQLLFSGETCKASGISEYIPEPPKGSVPLVRFTASFAETPDLNDYSVVYLSEDATAEYDGKLDALKLMNTDSQVPNIYTITPMGTKLSINAMPPLTDTLCKVQLGIGIEKDGVVIFRIKDLDAALLRYRIFIYDKVEGTETDISPGNEYRISLPKGEYNSRFFLCFSGLTMDSRDINTDDELLKVWQSYGSLRLNIGKMPASSGTVAIIDSRGRELLRKKVFHPGEYELSTDMVNGVYFVALTSANMRLVRKIYISKQ